MNARLFSLHSLVSKPKPRSTRDEHCANTIKHLLATTSLLLLSPAAHAPRFSVLAGAAVLHPGTDDGHRHAAVVTTAAAGAAATTTGAKRRRRPVRRRAAARGLCSDGLPASLSKPCWAGQRGRRERTWPRRLSARRGREAGEGRVSDGLHLRAVRGCGLCSATTRDKQLGSSLKWRPPPRATVRR